MMTHQATLLMLVVLNLRLPVWVVAVEYRQQEVVEESPDLCYAVLNQARIITNFKAIRILTFLAMVAEDQGLAINMIIVST